MESESKVEYEAVGFSEVLVALKSGKAAHRRGWNGKGLYVELQVPNKLSKMTVPYLYIVATKTENVTVVPWVPSQTDLMAYDWVIN